jgi:hypothetical protein
MLKFRPEILSADIMNFAFDTPLPENGHTGIVCTEVTVVIDAVIK